MLNVSPCERCAQVFADSSVVESMKSHHYEWTRSLFEILKSAAHGCLFCCLLKRSFALEKPTETQQSKIFVDKPINFRLRWVGFELAPGGSGLHSLMVDLENVGNETEFVDWGLNGIFSSFSKNIIFKIMSPKDDAAISIIKEVLPLPISSFESRMQLASDWMTDCMKNHSQCWGLEVGPLPTRILDLGQNKDIEQLNLRDDLAGKPGHYVCLSYCWGSSQTLLTKTNTIAEFKRGISLVSLPKTLQDAVAVTRKLGMRYLWIDALCILQDSDEDRAKECAKMDQIYQQAYITISAANVEDCHHGFLDRVSSFYEDLPMLPIMCPGGQKGSVFVIPELKHLFLDPLQARAWTLQEHVLSSRVIVWNQYNLFWQCTEGLKHQFQETYALSGPYHLRQRLLIPSIFDRNHGDDQDESSIAILHQALSGRAPTNNGYYSFKFAPDFVHGEMQVLWERLMVEYSKRKLSVKSDRPLALSGLVSRFREFVQDDYLAGHWRNWLLPHLLWRCADEKGAVRLPDSPSWSWLSVDGPVSVENLFSSDIKIFLPRPVATVISCKTTPRFQDAPYGQITSSELIIRGYLDPVMVDAKTRTFDLNYPYKVGEEQRFPKIALDDPSAFWRALEPTMSSLPTSPALPDTVWCLPLFIINEERRSHDVVVRGIVLIKSSRIHHQRVGWFYGGANWCYRDRTHGLLEKDITIV